MKPMLVISLLSLSIASLSGCAGSGQTSQPASVASNQPGSTPVSCVRETGTRIKPRTPSDCLNQPGRSYDRDAIDSTGATDAGAALRNLDPSITTH